MNTIKFAGYACSILAARYANGRLALRLIDAVDFAPICTVTVNVPEMVLQKDQVIVKNYAENKGVVDILVELGVLTRVCQFRPDGSHALMDVCTIHPEVLAKFLAIV